MVPPRSVLVKFRCRALKRPLEGDISNSPASLGLGELVFTAAPNSSIPEANPPKNHKGKKVAKEKTIIVNSKDHPTSKERSEFHVMQKDFPYPEIMDKELLVLVLLKCLHRDDENLANKFQWAGRMMLK